MALALSDPEHGYYATKDPFGRDFITAPEVSQMFGELLGLWMAQAWRDQGAPSPARLIELGPGRGTLMADALRAISKAAPDFFAAIDVAMVETSPVLQDVQREKLRAFPRTHWCGSFEDALAERPVFVLANEFFDALPVRQFVKAGGGWHERMVTVEESGDLAFALAPMAAKALAPPPARGPGRPGDVYEISPAAIAIAGEIGRAITKHGGAALIIDYGYETGGFADTLQAMKAHRYVDVLAEPGEADLTAHVDFTALAEAALEAGAKAWGPISQGSLLERLGIRTRAEQLQRANAKTDQQTAVARLIDPREMGTLFKALATVPETAAMPPGFESC
jgi:NADH dehydrogenase [ubiquinone] 1 alpha subcomplex assembly factor 7